MGDLVRSESLSNHLLLLVIYTYPTKLIKHLQAGTLFFHKKTNQKVIQYKANSKSFILASGITPRQFLIPNS